jgi:diguanylate cyclase (GGDEF)-like protein
MTLRNELLEAALELFPEGVALIGEDRHIVFWNRAAESITGYAAAELLAREAPDALEGLLGLNADCGSLLPHHGAHGCLVHAQHKFGYQFAALVRPIVLRNSLGARIGSGQIFHAAEGLDNLPHGDAGSDVSLETSQAELEDRLLAAFDDLNVNCRPFAVFWITVDQAHDLRSTHGIGACEAMLRRLQHSLVNGLKPGEEIGRWGQDEFLVLTHEADLDMAAAHAQHLAGLARTTDFRWWGDRVTLTASVGVAQALRNESQTLAVLLERARSAMQISLHAGGNRISVAPGRLECSPL